MMLYVSTMEKENWKRLKASPGLWKEAKKGGHNALMATRVSAGLYSNLLLFFQLGIFSAVDLAS